MLSCSPGEYSRRNLYRRWIRIRQRCRNNEPGYEHVTVCKEWDMSFPAFESWALANGYREDLTIDRINGRAGYCPDNCRWATRRTQSRNRKATILTETDAAQIKWLLGNTSETASTIATAFRVSVQTISDVKAGKTWGDVKPPGRRQVTHLLRTVKRNANKQLIYKRLFYGSRLTLGTTPQKSST